VSDSPSTLLRAVSLPNGKLLPYPLTPDPYFLSLEIQPEALAQIATAGFGVIDNLLG
jgi:hypothetical protein